MHTTYHLTSAQELSSEILESIKATYKTKPITIIVEEDNSYPALTNDDRLMSFCNNCYQVEVKSKGFKIFKD